MKIRVDGSPRLRLRHSRCLSGTFAEFSQWAEVVSPPYRSLAVLKGFHADISIHRIAINLFVDFLISFPDQVQRKPNWLIGYLSNWEFPFTADIPTINFEPGFRWPATTSWSSS